MKNIILTGDRPTGNLHIGHYVGSLKTRIELQKEIKRIHASLGNKTFMFVTHDINEAFFLGQRVMIMHEGRIEQFATPGEIISHPATPFVKELLGTVQQNQELWRQYHD